MDNEEKKFRTNRKNKVKSSPKKIKKIGNVRSYYFETFLFVVC